MADRLVVAIVSSCDPSRVEQSVAGLDRAGLRVLTTESESPDYKDSPIRFVHVAEAMSRNSLADDMTRGTGVIPDSGGTSVPGLSGPDTALYDAFAHTEVLDHLSGVEIPDGDAEFYNDAIDDGRCVVIYKCAAEQADPAKASLEKSGASNVKDF